MYFALYIDDGFLGGYHTEPLSGGQLMKHPTSELFEGFPDVPSPARVSLSPFGRMSYLMNLIDGQSWDPGFPPYDMRVLYIKML